MQTEYKSILLSIMKRTLMCLTLSLTFFAFHNMCYSQKMKIHVVSDDESKSKTYFQELADYIYLNNKKVKVEDLKISHYTLESPEPDIFQKKKKTVKYIPGLINCDYSRCAQISRVINAENYFTKLFIPNQSLECDLPKVSSNITRLEKLNKDYLLKIIKDELSVAKALNKNTSLIIYLPSAGPLSKPTLTIEADTIVAEMNEPVALNTTTTGNIERFSWFPSNGLSCSDCANPRANVRKTTTYSVEATDVRGCKTEEQKITVLLKEPCVDFSAPQLLFDLPGTGKYYQFTEDFEVIKISPFDKGSIVRLFTTRNCADNFEVDIIDELDEVILNKKYNREDLTKGYTKLKTRSGKDTFIFSLNIAEAEGFNDSDKDSFDERELQIRISSYDENGNNWSSKIYPKNVLFVKCKNKSN